MDRVYGRTICFPLSSFVEIRSLLHSKIMFQLNNRVRTYGFVFLFFSYKWICIQKQAIITPVTQQIPKVGPRFLFPFLSFTSLLWCFSWTLRSRVQFSEDGAWRSELSWGKIWFWQYHALRQEHLLKVGVSGYTFWLLIPFFMWLPTKLCLSLVLEPLPNITALGQKKNRAEK